MALENSETLTQDNFSSPQSQHNKFASPDGRKVQVQSNMGVLFSDDFGGSALDTTKWDVFQGGYTGIGGGVNAGPISYAVASSHLTVSMNTTSGDELWFLSKRIFAGAEDITAIVKFSQRLAANSVFVGLVEVDPATGNPIVNPNLAGDFNNRGGVELGATTATTTYTAQAVADGSSVVASGNAGTAAQTFVTGDEITIEFHAEDVIASSVAPDTVNAKGATPSRVSTQVPNDAKAYKLLLKFKNVSAPATNTDITIERVLVVDCQENRVEVTSGRGDTAQNKAVAVNLAGTATNAGMIQGAVASNGAGAINPVSIGVTAVTAAPTTAGTSARVQNALGDAGGRPVIKVAGLAVQHDFGKQNITATTETSLIAAAGAALRLELQSIVIANRDSIAHTVDIRDALAGTVRASFIVAAGATFSHSWPAGLPAAAVNTAWTAQLREAATTAVEVAVSAYHINA